MTDAEIFDITAPGWAGVNAEQPLPPPKSDTEQGAVDRALAHVFDSPDGEKVMEWLMAAYLTQPCWAPGYTTDFGFYREGQNTLIREMLMRANRAKAFKQRGK
jgi:hypothetical protein